MTPKTSGGGVMGQWTTLSARLNHLITQLRWGKKNYDSVHETSAELQKAASSLDSRYHTDSRTANDKCLSSLQWKVSHRWFCHLWTISRLQEFLHRDKASSHTKAREDQLSSFFNTPPLSLHPSSIPLPSQDQTPMPPGPLLPLLWFPITFPMPHYLFFLLNIEYHNKMLSQICLVPFHSLSKAWTVFHTCVYFLGNLPWYFALHLLDFFRVPIKWLMNSHWFDTAESLIVLTKDNITLRTEDSCEHEASQAAATMTDGYKAKTTVEDTGWLFNTHHQVSSQCLT